MTVSKEGRSYLALLAMYFAVPVVILTLISLFRPMYVERYLSHVSIGLMLLVGVSAALAWVNGRHKVRWAIAGMGLVMVSGVAHLTLVGNFNFQRDQKPAINAVAAQMQ